MATVLHSSLTGTDIHEPKGLAAAQDGATLIADGSGSGNWVTLPVIGYRELNAHTVSSTSFSKFGGTIGQNDVVETYGVVSFLPDVYSMKYIGTTPVTVHLWITGAWTHNIAGAEPIYLAWHLNDVIIPHAQLAITVAATPASSLVQFGALVELVENDVVTLYGRMDNAGGTLSNSGHQRMFMHGLALTII